MTAAELENVLQTHRIVPVVTVEDGDQGVKLAAALRDGGLPLMEITFRSDAAAEAIRRVTAECPEVTVGAGTVLTTAQVDAAVKAGAQFIVAPGFNPTVVDHCQAKGITMTPGVVTPSEMEWAMERGIHLLKFFPAEQSGGVDYLKAVSAPYRTLKFMPTGGVTPGNLAAYLGVPSVVACGGTWMVKLDMIRAGEFDRIRTLVQEAVRIAQSG